MPFERDEPDQPRLRPQQEWLLAQLVEAHLSQPAEKRHPFWRFTILGGPHVINHAGFSGLPDGRLECPVSDVDILRQVGLLAFLDRDTFYLTPLAFEHYEQTKARVGEPLVRVEQKVRRYLDPHLFREQCSAAYDKWADAERHLWSARVERDLTNIGHLCREAMQSFATCMVERFEPPNVDRDQAARREPSPGGTSASLRAARVHREAVSRRAGGVLGHSQ